MMKDTPEVRRQIVPLSSANSAAAPSATGKISAISWMPSVIMMPQA